MSRGLLGLLLELPWCCLDATSHVDDVLAQVQSRVKVLSASPDSPPASLPIVAHAQALAAEFRLLMGNMSECTRLDEMEFYLFSSEALAQVLGQKVGAPIHFGPLPTKCSAWKGHMDTGDLVDARSEWDVCTNSAMNLTVACADALFEPVSEIWRQCMVTFLLPQCIQECYHNSSFSCVPTHKACHTMQNCIKLHLVQHNPFWAVHDRAIPNMTSIFGNPVTHMTPKPTPAPSPAPSGA